MKKLIIMLLFVLTFAGCSKDTSSTEGTESTSGEETKTATKEKDSKDDITSIMESCLTEGNEETVDLDDVYEFLEDRGFEIVDDENSKGEKFIRGFYNNTDETEHTFVVTIPTDGDETISGCYSDVRLEETVKYEGHPIVFSSTGAMKYSGEDFIYNMQLLQMDAIDVDLGKGLYLYDMDTEEIAFESGDDFFDEQEVIDMFEEPLLASLDSYNYFNELLFDEDADTMKDNYNE